MTQPWSQALLASLASTPADHDAGDRLLQRLLLENMAAALRARETARPLAAGWQAAAVPPPPCTFHDPCLSAARQTIHLPTGTDGSDAYLYLDHTQHRIDLSVAIGHEAATLVRLGCPRVDAPADDPAGPALEGFLYLRARWRGARPLVRVRVPASQSERERVMHSIVVMCDGSYTRVAALHSEPRDDVVDYYFGDTGPAGNREFWFGIPFFADLRFQAELTLIQDGIPGSAEDGRK